MNITENDSDADSDIDVEDQLRLIRTLQTMIPM